MFDRTILLDFLNKSLWRAGDETPEEDVDMLADLLNGFVDTQLPEGLPYLTLSVAQAEIIRDMFAMPWIQCKLQIVAFETLAHLPVYAATLGKPESYAQIKGARQELARIEYVLQHLTRVAPDVDKKEFIVFTKDPRTHMVTPMLNPVMMERYRARLFDAWRTIPIRTEYLNDAHQTDTDLRGEVQPDA